MPVVSEDVYRILFTLSRYLFPFLAAMMLLFAAVWLLSESRFRRDRVRSLPGSGLVGELIVLSGSRELSINTWFPVPREGVLGSVRSCDLVVPCPGVHPHHLDFSWQDGQGLLLYPHTGCEALINGAPVNCRSDAAALPLTHGAVLQVGSAVLRFHLFAALDNLPIQQEVFPQAIQPVQPAPPVFDGCQPPLLQQVTPLSDAAPAPLSDIPAPDAVDSCPPASAAPVVPVHQPQRTRRSDRWKEELGE